MNYFCVGSEILIVFSIQDLKMVQEMRGSKASPARVAKAATEAYPVRWDYPSGKEAQTRDEYKN